MVRIKMVRRGFTYSIFFAFHSACRLVCPEAGAYTLACLRLFGGVSSPISVPRGKGYTAKSSRVNVLRCSQGSALVVIVFTVPGNFVGLVRVRAYSLPFGLWALLGVVKMLHYL